MKNINKKFLLLAAILIIFYLILISAIFFNTQTKNDSPQSSSQPTPTLVEIQQNPNRNPGQNNSVDYSPEEVSASQKERSIGELLLKLPHKGTFFELNYEYQTDSFNFIVDSANKQQANSELEGFLKSFNLAKTDLQNLFTSSK